ncbi:AAA family ATPase [Pseudoalteromonas luteoviolacea]|uniref:AAA family ATPase n=1 Tax=Pseudoalteromonas luteoviolacea TaxID=43657 RepID=UPI001B3A427D|nr:AAA family ATPase [Pseudoalteromonas luteoviolacea]MBQ4876271.1 AAA family ATPase [Pseudoalteromonas luteoviolacea]MBQ4906305.1 AAA family ATPase [Pseudoalteromonas luteoviolacea]
MKDYPKSVKRLLKASDKHKFESTYQLYNIFAKGLSVEADPGEADKFKRKCKEQLEGYQFRLASLALKNFKSVGGFKFNFGNSNTIVFVGNNGSGKSTVLEAIEKSLSNITSRIATQSFNGDEIKEFEIKVGQHEPARIMADFQLNGVSFPMELIGNHSLKSVSERSVFKGINHLSSLLKSMNDFGRFNFPLLASYNVERSNDVTTRDIDKSEEIIDSQVWDQSKAYSKSLNGKSDFKLFFRWFKELIEARNDDSHEISKLRESLKEKQAFLDGPGLKAMKESQKDSIAFDSFIKSYEDEIKQVKSKINNLSTFKDNTLEQVCNAIYEFLPSFSELRIQRKPLDMLVKKDGVEFSVLQLSQGEKSLLALVADIARRLMLLNPSLDNPLEGTGIVLIDEIDLHLHPSWQQKIVTGLARTFPNIQFFISTHSPQVCHTLDSNSVWLIDNGEARKAPKGLRGSMSSWVLQNLFDVEPRPPEDKFTQDLAKYERIVYEDQYNSDEARNLKEKLAEHFGYDYDILVKLDLYVENREWEKEFEENK